MAEPPDGVSAALEQLIARLGERVRRVARGHRLSGTDVDEVLQEVRIRLWRALQTGEKIEAAPASYVYRTAVSAALDLIRRRRARREDSVDAARTSGETVLGAVDGPDGAIEHAELADRVMSAVDALLESRRPVVRMYLAGYTLEELADLLGWTEAKTRNLLYRGLADLRARLTEMGIGPETAE